ncbi:hypothetical protein [Nocardiopsis alborubida]|uniref:Uncharacterized protein n=1 Tax=Nocardiopsis alborubida TaxID=146802 RepID=A0A7X6MIC3_9ACTN|nr:hypothetical protein [Nocardiopsis alborubida]NKZ01887.1 hypothetical protein [Nocardiopsis alborubida]
MKATKSLVTLVIAAALPLLAAESALASSTGTGHVREVPGAGVSVSGILDVCVPGTPVCLDGSDPWD